MMATLPGHVCTVRGAAVTATFHYISREFGESSLDRIVGELREALGRTSGRQARMVETQCVTQGAPLCEWAGDWSGSSLF